MDINVFGIGYVGCVTAGCLARDGHTVHAIDIDTAKVDMINSGRSPIVEPGLEEVIRSAVRAHRLEADVQANNPADVSFVCVGTPSNDNGSLRYDYILKLAKEIGRYLGDLPRYHVVNIRSTVLPETVEKKVIPLIERSAGKKAGDDFGVCMNPEFLREGTSLHDFYHPPFTVIGQFDTRSGDTVAELYQSSNAPIIRTTIRVAEIVKYACNSFHALKVVFANEIGNFCKKLNIDSHEVFDIFCLDTKLNLSSYYLKPGFAFGGSCLPKDISALLYKGKALDLETPVLASILRSNRAQVDHAYRLIRNHGKKKVGVLGLSFKPGTDDLRDSPIVELVEKLIGKGYEVSIYDREVSLAKLFGANKRYIEKAIPHISSLMRQTAAQVVRESEVIIFAKKDPAFEELAHKIGKRKKVLDLVRLFPKNSHLNGCYEGICW